MKSFRLSFNKRHGKVNERRETPAFPNSDEERGAGKGEAGYAYVMAPRRIEVHIIVLSNEL